MAIPWVSLGHHWVSAAHYDAGDLYVQYTDRNGNVQATCWYQGVPLSMWTDLLTAGNKGKWVHQSGLYKWPYTLI